MILVNKIIYLFNGDTVNNFAKTLTNIPPQDPSILKNNKKLVYIAIGIIVTLIIMLIMLTIYFKFYTQYHIHWGHILIENSIIFAFVGLIEYVFFTQIALNYVPTSPSDMGGAAFDKIEANFNNYLLNSS